MHAGASMGQSSPINEHIAVQQAACAPQTSVPTTAPLRQVSPAEHSVGKTQASPRSPLTVMGWLQTNSASMHSHKSQLGALVCVAHGTHFSPSSQLASSKGSHGAHGSSRSGSRVEPLASSSLSDEDVVDLLASAALSSVDALGFESCGVGPSCAVAQLHVFSAKRLRSQVFSRMPEHDKPAPGDGALVVLYHAQNAQTLMASSLRIAISSW